MLTSTLLCGTKCAVKYVGAHPSFPRTYGCESKIFPRSVSFQRLYGLANANVTAQTFSHINRSTKRALQSYRPQPDDAVFVETVS